MSDRARSVPLLFLLLQACPGSPRLEGRQCDFEHPCPNDLVCTSDQICRRRCESTAECASAGLVCIEGVCGRPMADACTGDCGGETDAAQPDADERDGGVELRDAEGAVDAEPFDAEPTDALPDGGVADGGFEDVGVAEDAGVTRTIEGIRVLEYVVDQNVIAVPQNLTNDVITATFHDGASFQTLPGLGQSNGTFDVAGIPIGPYLLRWRGYVFATTAGTLDLGRPILARPDRIEAATPTQVTLTVNGLDPWVAGSALWLSSVEVAGWTGDLYRFGGTPPAAGATSASVVADYSLGDAPYLIEAGSGDTAVITQHVRNAGPPDHLAVRRSASLGNVSMVDGRPIDLNATLAPLPSLTFELDWRASEFEALAPDVHASAALTGHYVRISPVPGGLSRGYFGYMAYILHVFRGSGSTVAGDLVFSNPYPGSELVVRSHTDFSIQFQLPGTTALSFPVTFLQLERFIDVTGSPLRPIVSPPRAVMINGLSANVDRAGVGTTPVISWSPPSIGTPDDYRVLIHRLFDSGGATQSNNTWIFYTRETSLQLPPYAFPAGDTYFLEIEARINTGVDIEETPFERGLPYADAATFTGLVSP
jgi:hypothetical protein